MNNNGVIIKRLKNKIKSLQIDLCQRTRSFLLRQGLKNAIILDRTNQQTQTDSYSHGTFNNSEYLQTISPACEPEHDKFRNEVIKISSKVNVSEFRLIENQQIFETKQKISNLLEELSQQQRINENKCEEVTIDDLQSQQNQSQAFDREKRRLKREIKKLGLKLDFQRKINQIAKEGLLISEEQNYQFRLKIVQLMKSQEVHQNTRQLEQIPKDHYDLQIIELQANLNHERQLKQQYLENALELQDQIHKLTEQNERLKNFVTNLNENQKFASLLTESTKMNDFSNKSCLFDEQIFQRIKNTAFHISNCIPVTNQQEDINYFRPENDIEVLDVLKRAEEYCKQIQKWELQRVEAIAREKKLFIDVLNKISLHIDSVTSQRLQFQMTKIEEMSHFISIFRRKQVKTERTNELEVFANMI